MYKAASELRKALTQLQFDEEYAARLQPKDRLEYLMRILEPLHVGSGRHRTVFGINGHYVVKVPFYPGYAAINTAERNIFRKRQRAGIKWSKDRPDPARCCIVTVAGQKLLVMERLTKVRTPDDEGKQVPKGWPQWVHRLDCEQCGISTRTGKVVAFDYGTDISAFDK